MKRVKASCLTAKNGKYYYGEEPFSGVAFEILEGGELKAMTNYREGLPAGDYVNDYLPRVEGLLHIDDDFLEEHESNYTGEPFSYRESPFTGISYEFINDCCVSEQLYRKGILDSDAGYFQSGRLESIDVRENGLSREFVWDEEGVLLKMKIFEKDSLNVTIEFDEAHSLKSLRLEGDYFGRIAELKERVKFPLYEERAFLKDISGSDFLFLSGDSLDDELLLGLIENDGLINTAKLTIYNSPLTEASLKRLKELKSLKELRVKSEDKRMLSTLKDIKKGNPGLEIILNEENV